MGLTPRKGEQVPVESERMQGPPQAGPAEGKYVRTWEGCNLVEGTHCWSLQKKGYLGTPGGCDLVRGANKLGPEEGGTCGGKGKGETD